MTQGKLSAFVGHISIHYAQFQQQEVAVSARSDIRSAGQVLAHIPELIDEAEAISISCLHNSGWRSVLSSPVTGVVASTGRSSIAKLNKMSPAKISFLYTVFSFYYEEILIAGYTIIAVIKAYTLLSSDSNCDRISPFKKG